MTTNANSNSQNLHQKEHPVMTKTQETVVSGLTSRMRLLGLDFCKLAELMYKDDNTIRRQLTSPNSNLTLNTIDDYIKVIGGELVYVSPESALVM